MNNNEILIDTRYEILVTLTNEVHTFTTARTEKDFYDSLDAVYGKDNYKTLSVEKLI